MTERTNKAANRDPARTGRVYLDHASSTPLRPAAFDAMVPYLRDHFGDPGRLHAEGLATRVAVEDAREQVAALFGARPREVVFTSGAAESINGVVYGALKKAARAGRRHVVTTAVEQAAVRESLARTDAEITVIPVDEVGRVDPDAVVAAVRPDTALVSIQLGNQEVGTVQPAGAIIEALRETAARRHAESSNAAPSNAESSNASSSDAAGANAAPLVHVDAVAAAGHLPITFGALGADLVSIGANALGGPAGAGAVLVRRGLRIDPFIVGGAQERARRAGLENVAAIVGFGAAAAILDTDHQLAAEIDHARTLTGQLVDALGAMPGITQYGDPVDRLANLVCFGVAGIEAEPILLGLDRAGIAVHSGSACSSEMLEPSPVLAAMGADADHSLRISVGWNSNEDDIEAFLAAFPVVIDRLRALRTE